ncbi:hypothetical protein [Legionella saoudiensis]|uniref:hypothetical protein n=1 Tax=Legionella saoudiensis TaxID=1750561 RepID=UPI000730E98E|nr:hypothetical protein [Legionella saoudiensis]
MFDNFSEVEKKYLNELKINLWEHPGEYFFRYYRNFNEFKEINYSMWIGQWQYVSSGFSMLFETFKILRQVASSLFALNFSNAMSLTHDAAKEGLTALTKLTLGLGLLCLNLCRSFTLFVATFHPQLLFASLTVCSAYLYFMVLGNPLLEAFTLVASSIFLGIFGGSITGTLKKNSDERMFTKKQREESLERELFVDFWKKMNQEQIKICKLLDVFVDRLDLTSQALNHEQRFFSDPELLAKLKREFRDDIEFFRALSELLTSYPEVSFTLASRERSYADMMYKELAEHHARVISMAELLVQKMDKLPENKAQEHNSLIAMK